MAVKATTKKQDWSNFRPLPVEGAMRAFGAVGASFKTLAPMYEGYKSADVPEQFTRHNGTIWNDLISDWFFKGLDTDRLDAKPGIDKNAALAHVGAILRSFEPAHETKEAICAYLLSLWFEEPAAAGSGKDL